MSSKQTPASDESLVVIADTLKEMHRPRLFLDIVPETRTPNFLDVILRNSGGSAAYNISCRFEPDLKYYKDVTLSDMTVFKNLPFLEPRQEIRFFFRDLLSIVSEGPAYGPKQSSVTITYKDSKGVDLEEKYNINIERYKDLLYVDQHGINDLFKELGNIRRELELIQRHGLLIKKPEDLEKERKHHRTSVRRISTKLSDSDQQKKNKR